MHSTKSVQIRSFFWSVFFCIWTEYGYSHHKSPYSVQIRKNTDQKKLHIWTLFSQWYKNIEKLQLVREMITQVVVCCAIIILRTLQYDSNRFKQTTSTWCWSKSNTTNEFYWKSRSSRRCNNIFHYWRSGKNNLRFF